MAFTQDTILTFLLKRNGKAKNSEFLSEFKGLLNCSDLEEKKQNRDLFKTFVNHVAVVKEIEGEKHIVLKKRYVHLLKEFQALRDQKTEFGEYPAVTPDSPGEQRGPCESEGAYRSNPANSKESSDLDNSKVQPLSNTNCDDCNCSTEPSAVELALERSVDMDSARLHTGTNILPCKVLQVNSSKDNEVSPSGHLFATDKVRATAPQKPFMLPLRMPPTTRPIIVDFPVVNAKDESSGTGSNDQDLEKSPRSKRRLFEEIQTPTSPHPERGLKNAKPTEEPKYSATVPLETSDHEWLVKSATGQWSQVHGLLLQDAQLALKKDFMSGFTVLHWAAKGGNLEMVGTIIELCQRDHTDFDINARSHGGYTALHIAAIHDHRRVMVLLVSDYGADIHIRDNNGKKPYHYLRQEVPADVRELLGEAQASPQEPVQEKSGDDHFAEISKGFSTIGRLFHKHKQRPGFQPVLEDVEDENEESLPRNRTFSDVFKQGLAPH
ncbi:ankyrin repeat domain-containing protein SOWAHA-like [Conger conger]|uniref:ankyrin repeat domain-containing protein SOWAHA-like n=1 Tax=Conger conger TaxID=82655 RepID=UPI002A5A501B|nr:ankyrin repeat domain-containing protein SOWAHA-like [Conger conger]